MKDNTNRIQAINLSGLNKTVPMLIAVALLIPATGHTAAAGGGINRADVIANAEICSLTTESAFRACRSEVQDDFFIGYGNCLNVADNADRAECFSENYIERDEAQDECSEQSVGRDEVCELLGEGQYDPEYEPEDFVDPAAIGDTVEPNAYFPLVVGMRWVYESEDERVVVEVLEGTREIDGVMCAIVRDTVTEIGDEDEGGEFSLEEDGEEEGDFIEDTHDWYAQDKDGNVWYFGEIAVNYEDGELADLEGSWESGEDGARPGVQMLDMPTVGTAYRQEWLLGDAEDMAQVESLTAKPDLADENVGDCSDGCLQMAEWNPLESDSFEYKYYQAGIGMVQEEDPETGETLELVEFSE